MDKKICTKCKKELPLSSFPKNKVRPDGLEYRCKECNTQMYRLRREKNPEHYRAKDRKYYEAHKEEIKQRRIVDYKNNPHKRMARQKIMTAVYSGKAIRPNSCSACGKLCTPEAHHEDYSKPLDVVWLCDTCHGRHHSNINNNRILS